MDLWFPPSSEPPPECVPETTDAPTTDDAAALDWWRRNRASIDLVFTDLVMPGAWAAQRSRANVGAPIPQCDVRLPVARPPEYDPGAVTMIPEENAIPEPATTEQTHAVVRRQLERAFSATS